MAAVDLNPFDLFEGNTLKDYSEVEKLLRDRERERKYGEKWVKSRGPVYCQARISLKRHISIKKSRSLDVCLSPDKSMIMCWHPEPEFPYEHTQSLPRDKTELEQADSVLKVQYLVDEKLKNRPDGPTVNELTELFYAHKEDFKRRPRHEKKTEQVKYIPKDRDGL